MNKSLSSVALPGLLTGAVLLTSGIAPALERKSDPRSLSMYTVELIGLDSNMCSGGISKEMYKSGFLVTDKLDVSDAILEVNVNPKQSVFTHPNQVEDAHYSAVLLGVEDRVLFSTGGNVNAHDLKELCEDIGDDIIRGLNAQIQS